MSEEPEWSFFEAFCAGAIEAAMKSRDHRSWSISEHAEMIARLILRNAQERFVIKPEAEE